MKVTCIQIMILEIHLGDKMANNPNYWKLKGTIKKLKDKEKKCFVCGSTENIVPHHLKKVNQASDEYYSEDNLVLLCDEHHHQYHQQYLDINPKTFCEFLRKNHLKKPKNRGKTMNFKLEKELKNSKLRKIIKLLNKTNKKIVKISVNGKLYDISRIKDLEKYIVFELDDVEIIKKEGELMIIDLDEELRLSRFRKIMTLIKSNKLIKIFINGTYYDISQIIDKKDMTILEVNGVDESEIIKTNLVNEIC